MLFEVLWFYGCFQFVTHKKEAIMTKNSFVRMFLLGALLSSCNQKEVSILDEIAEEDVIIGKEAYINSPYITAGDRVYSVGHQDGSFPELGWHIKDEMGGIWNHPIKLMDGFEAALTIDGQKYGLQKATSFRNYPYANAHQYEWDTSPITATRVQLVPDHLEGMIIQYELQNKEKENVVTTFEFTGHTDLRPTWLGEQTNMIDGPDGIEFDAREEGWISKDENNNWFVLFGSDLQPNSKKVVENSYTGKGASASLSYEVAFKPGETKTISFYIAGSYEDKNAVKNTFNEIKKNSYQLVADKKSRYQTISNTSKLTTPDTTINEVFKWLKYNSDWFVRTVPEIGTGIAAGYPDYPWWFGCDSEYALLGYLSIGEFDLTKKTIALLDTLSKKTNANGRIVHEVSTNGVVFNKGNTNETPQFVSLVWNAYLWTGDLSLLEDYFPQIEKGLAWLLSAKDENGNLIPEGAGMMEIHGLESEMIDVAAYTQRAFEDAYKIASVLQRDSVAATYREYSKELKNKINDEFWSPEFRSYADFIGTDEEALQLIEDAIVRADTLHKPWAVEELIQTKKYIIDHPSDQRRPFVLHHNWVVNTPMETGVADAAKAKMALETGRKFTNPFGVFVTGIDRDESAEQEEGSFKGSKQFSYTGAVMTLPTGVSAIAENNYGDPDKALDYLKRMGKSFSFALPGSIYEVSPDYGMFAQAWNIYSYAIPIIHQFFGLSPNAHDKEISIKPNMPSGWKNASLENVKVGSTTISITYEETESNLIITVNQTEKDWNISVVPPNGYNTTPNMERKGTTTTYAFSLVNKP
jgi:glycogen debranching enzyme